MKLYGIFSLIILFASIAGTADKVPRMVTFPIPLLVEGENKGAFIQLMKEISERSQRKIQIDILPLNKAMLQFANGQADAYFPGLDTSVPKDSLRSIPFYVRTDYIFYRDSRPLKKIKDLHGKNVGLTFRYHYTNELMNNPKIKFTYAEDDVINMRRLAEGTIDAFVVEERSGIRAVEMSKSKGISYSKDHPVSSQNCFFAFKNSPEGKALLKDFNATLEKMKEDGSLDKLLRFPR